MTFERRRAWAAGILLVGALLGAAWLLRLDYARKISTDVLDLIPTDERSPELTLVRTMASEREARTMLLVLSTENAGGAGPRDGGAVTVEVARRFAEELRKSGVFAQAVALGDTAWRDEVGKELFARRMTLLFPTWLAARAAEESVARRAVRELKAFLEKPEAVAFQELVPADPLLLMTGAVEKLKIGLEMGGAMNGAGGAQQLIWAQLAVSPLREEGQGPAFAAIERALADVRKSDAGIKVAYTGVNRFAAASRQRIEREVSWLNVASVIAVLAVAGGFIRAVHRALHLVPVIAFATLGAWVATTLVFERVHVVVLALGALLAGVAIDYGFYLFMQPPARPEEAYPEKVRRLAKPLIASCGTTVAGFALLVFSDFPMIRQLGVFVGAGLVCALGAAVLYFALLRNAFLPAREWGQRALVGGSAGRRGGVRRWAIVAVWVGALVGLWRVQWRDDVRDLEVPAREVAVEDARIRAVFGQRSDRPVFLSHGRTLDEARAAVAELERVAGANVSLANLAAVVPTQAEAEAARAWARGRSEFTAELRAALEEEGFEGTAFEPFFAAWAEYARGGGGADEVREAVVKLQEKLAGPLGLLLHVGRERSWFVSIASGPVAGLERTEGRTVSASQLTSLNRLFAGYRAAALRLSLAGLGLVGVGVLLTYGVCDGVRIFAIPCGVCLGVFGVFGWIGQPLNMFHLLGAFLGVCLTHNYSIFTATSVYRGEAIPMSVRLSALTTGASFGVLAFSGIPVVRALGLTVAAMVVAALVVIELEALGGLRAGAGREGTGK